MNRIFLLLALTILASCKSTTYFIVRHAEKEPTTTMTTDVPLSAAGAERALALREELRNEKLTAIFSTNYRRTQSTAQPLAELKGLTIQTYSPTDSNFIGNLKSMKGKILVVGHSNTVDNLINGLTGIKTISGDLPDTQYGDLYIVRKNGKKIRYELRHFGK